jgi:hypothetical protein
MDDSSSDRLTLSIGRIGFLLSIVGLTSIAFVGWTRPTLSEVGSYLAFSSLPGLASSAAGHLSRPTKATRWGIAVGLLGSFYLGTMWFGLTRH